MCVEPVPRPEQVWVVGPGGRSQSSIAVKKKDTKWSGGKKMKEGPPPYLKHTVQSRTGGGGENKKRGVLCTR